MALLLEFYTDFYVKLFVIARPSDNQREKNVVPRLPESELRESLNDVTFVVSLPRRRAFARLNCKLRLHSPSLLLSLLPRFFSRFSFPESRFIAVTLERFIFFESPA